MPWSTPFRVRGIPGSAYRSGSARRKADFAGASTGRCGRRGGRARRRALPPSGHDPPGPAGTTHPSGHDPPEPTRSARADTHCTAILVSARGHRVRSSSTHYARPSHARPSRAGPGGRALPPSGHDRSGAAEPPRADTIHPARPTRRTRADTLEVGRQSPLPERTRSARPGRHDAPERTRSARADPIRPSGHALHRDTRVRSGTSCAFELGAATPGRATPGRATPGRAEPRRAGPDRATPTAPDRALARRDTLAA